MKTTTLSHSTLKSSRKNEVNFNVLCVHHVYLYKVLGLYVLSLYVSHHECPMQRLNRCIG